MAVYVLYAKNHCLGAIEVNCENDTHSTFYGRDHELEQQHAEIPLGP